MAENVLEKIINIKSKKILELKKSISLESLEEYIKKIVHTLILKIQLKKMLKIKNSQLLLK